MKKLLFLTVAAMMSFFAYAECPKGGDGSTKPDAIEFCWEEGHDQYGSETLWYRVDLSPLYQEDVPTLNFCLQNPTLMDTVEVKMKATVGGQVVERQYKILPGQTKSQTGNASLLLKAHQTEVFVALTTKTKDEGAHIHFSARLFDAVDLDDACENAVAFDWKNGITQKKGAIQWIKVNLTEAKKKAKEEKQDIKLSITNQGSGVLNLRSAKSMDCPSSGLTKRSFKIEAGATYTEIIPAAAVTSIAEDEVFYTLDNSQPVKVVAEFVPRPATPLFDFSKVAVDSLPVVCDMTIAAGTHYYKINVKQMNDSLKYEPEFTFLGLDEAAKIDRKMSYEEEVWGWQGSVLELAANEEHVEVIKKNVVDGINAKYIYLVIENDKPFQLIGRYKHVREGKACKNNIPFDWDNGHFQEGKTTQWYAIDVTAAKAAVKDIKVTIENVGYDKATVKGALAFSCPYIDLQEITRSIAAGKSISTKLSYATYAMMSEVVYVGATTDQDISIKAELVDPTDAEMFGDACLTAKEFDWTDGAKQEAGEAVWYKLAMKDVTAMQVMPTVKVFNLGDKEVKIDGVMSLECPDDKPNQERSLKIAAKGVYTKQLSKNMFENISVDTIYLRVAANQPIAFEIALTEEPEGSSCSSAINFNWERGNDQKANENLWYRIDLRKAMKTDKDVKISLVNKDEKKACEGTIQLAFDCNVDAAPQIQKFTLAAGKTRSTVQPHSMLETAIDSVVLVRLVGNTALHVEAELVDAEPLPEDQQVSCETLEGAEKLAWNTEYPLKAGEAKWFVLEKAVLNELLADATSAEAIVTELSGEANSIKAEVAYKCPITTKMMSKTTSLSAKQVYIKEIGENIAKQAAAHDQIFIRVTAKKALKFEAKLIKTDTGDKITTPVRVKFGEKYEQAAGTTRFYRINTADIKAQLNHGSRVHVTTNTLAENATLKAKVYEDIVVQHDWLEGKGKRTIGKGRGLNRDIPAYEILGVADKIVTIELTTDKDITIESKLSEYPKLAEPKPLVGRDSIFDGEGNFVKLQPRAQFVVPNIDYTIEPGGQWLALCLPYLRNNYKIDKDASFRIVKEAGSVVTVETAATWEDTLHYAIPHRSRKLDKKKINGKDVIEYSFIEAIDKAIASRGYSYSVAGTDPAFIDSLVREAITTDSLTAYIYIKVSEPIQWRINMPRTTGFDCDAAFGPMPFDWEHGNFKEAGVDMWYNVRMDQSLIPEGKDLRLHVENWADEANTLSAEFFEACEKSDALPEIKSAKLAAKQDSAKTVRRALIPATGFANYQIKLSSEKAAYIWAEFVDSIPVNPEDIIKDTLPDELVVLDPVCAGSDIEELKVTINKDTTWFSEYVQVAGPEPALAEPGDTLKFQRKQYDVKVLVAATLPDLSGFKPAFKEGEAVVIPEDVQALLEALKTPAAGVQKATEIIWEISEDCGVSFKAVDATPLASAIVSLRCRVIFECGDELTSAVIENDAKIEDIIVPAENVTECHEYTWPRTGETYYESKTVTFTVEDALACGKIQKTIYTLNLTITEKVVNTLVLDAKFGRILMIDRQQLLNLGWTVDELPEFAPAGLVKWFFNDAELNDAKYNNKGYYLTYEKGETLPNGKYRAVVDTDPEGCGKKAVGEIDINVAPAAAPALMPTLAQPNEDIKVLNLDPEQTTIIRVYTTEGLIQGTYTTTGVETFIIKAAADHGFYMVELSNEGLNTTLRYIVK